MTICKRFGIESLKFSKYSVDISWHHTFFSSSCRISRLGVFFSDIFFFILCQQFSIGFKFELLPGHSGTLTCFCSRYLIIFLALTGCTVMHEHFRAMNMVKVEHVLFHDLQVEFTVNRFVLGEKVQASPAFFPRKTSPSHYRLWMFNGRNSVSRIKAF